MSWAQNLNLAFTSTGGGCNTVCALYCRDLEHMPSAISLLAGKFIQRKPNPNCVKNCFSNFANKIVDTTSRSCEDTYRSSIITDFYADSVCNLYNRSFENFIQRRILHGNEKFWLQDFRKFLDDCLEFFNYYDVKSCNDLEIILPYLYEETNLGWKECTACNAG